MIHLRYPNYSKGENGKSASTFYLAAALIVFFIISESVSSVSSEKILFLLPLSTKSHKIFFEPLITTLAERGHEVIVLTTEKTIRLPRSKNLTVQEYVPLTGEELMQGFPDPFEIKMKSKNSMSFPLRFVVEGCHKVIQSDIFQQAMSVKSFDLIIVDSFLSNCLDGFIYKSGVPFILVTTMPAPSYISERVGNFLPPSFIPVLSFRGYSEHGGEMNFWGRLRNFGHFLLARLYVNFVILPNLEKVYREYLGDDAPGIPEIEAQSKLILMNSHYSMNFPRPLLPTVVEVGGIHCRRPRSITNPDLAKFISKSSAPNGFIYFSLGSIINLSNAPSETIRALFDTFSKLKQRVVIKWKQGINQQNHNMSISRMNLPGNVWIGDWFSQQDLLGHENIRLFISHGGLLSMQESVYHGVPVIGIPMGIDQDTNVHNAVLQGYALKLDLKQMDEETLTAAINMILDDSSFSENVKSISKAFRQRQSSPLDTAVFWTEYVLSTIRDNATHFIQSPSRKLNIFQYYSCDILLFLLASLLIITAAILLVGIRGMKLGHRLVTDVKSRIVPLLTYLDYDSFSKKIH